ncbi:hypothetical protein PAMP_014926 [Pampus punctatissimus]
MQLLRVAWALTGAAICCFLILLIHSRLLKEGQLAAGTCEIVTLDRDSSQPRRTIARQTARCACKKGQIAGTTRARPACVDVDLKIFKKNSLTFCEIHVPYVLAAVRYMTGSVRLMFVGDKAAQGIIHLPVPFSISSTLAGTFCPPLKHKIPSVRNSRTYTPPPPYSPPLLFSGLQMYHRKATFCIKKGKEEHTAASSENLETAGIVRKKQWCEMVPCLEDEGCDLLVNKSGWTCTQPGGRVKTTTVEGSRDDLKHYFTTTQQPKIA